MEDNKEEKLELIALKSFEEEAELYKVVDFLNKSLREKKLMFGIAKDDKEGFTLSIYEI
ncbi:hypothetical protein GGQ84_002048 [Desulfitispora alkaliphila]|uniref:YpmA family protein n=1 Tax=Desulfitispora alkaliphila TaxID=622674 RepID=UPI003D1E3851